MTRLRSPAVIALVSIAGLVATGCGAAGQPGAGGSSSATSGPRSSQSSPASYPADRLLLRVNQVGGFIAPVARVDALPQVSVYGDGRVLSPGAVTAQAPAPLVRPVTMNQVPPERLPGLLAAARAAGIDGRSHDLGHPSAADLPTTVFTAYQDGRTVSLAVPGLEALPGAGQRGLTPAQRAARAKLAAFRAELVRLAQAGSQTYRPEGLAVFAAPSTGGTGPVVAWRGPDPATGEPATAAQGRRCFLVTGDALDRVLPQLSQATTATRWRSGGEVWSFAVRPLLPDESSCADVEAAAAEPMTSGR